jgi:hypothetical protein
VKSLSYRQKLFTFVRVAALLFLAAAGILLAGCQRGNRTATPTIVQQTTPTWIVSTAAPTATETPTRVAVKNGHAESDTGIAILPSVELQGNRKYVLQVTSKAGALPFKGFYSRGSLDPIAVDAMKEIAGTTPWEVEIAPPVKDARSWTLGVSLNTDPVGKNVQVQVWDVGQK